MKKLVFMAMLSCMIMACVSNGKQSGDMNESQGDSVVLDVQDSNEVVLKDTIDIETYLNKMESMLIDIKQIQIKKEEDTLKYESLIEKWNGLDSFVIADFDKDELKHSVKVKYLKVMAEYLSEMMRLSKELKAAGIRVNEKDDEEFEKSQKLIEKQLWQETH